MNSMLKVKKQNRQNYIVFISATLVSICFLLGSFLFLYKTKLQNEQKSIKYLHDVTSQRKAVLDQQMKGDLQVLRGVAIGLAEFDLKDKELLLNLLDGVNRSNSFVQMGLADIDGTIDLVDLDGTVHEGVDLSNTSFFQAALMGGDGVSGSLPAFTTGRGVNYYTTPVYQDGKIVGVLCGVNTDEIRWNILNIPVFQGEGQFLVIDSQGVIVSRGGEGDEMHYGLNIANFLWLRASEKEALQQALQTGASGSYSAETEGQKVIVTSYPLGYNDWHVMSIIPRAGITAYYNRTAVGIMVMMLIACLLFFQLLMWQTRMMNRNKESLERLAYTDILTGARNQAKFLLDAESLLEEKGERKYAVWSLDIKKFTSINDLFGVAVGDQMLIRISSMLDGLSHKKGAFCRIAGDLFAGLMPYHEKQDLYDWVSQLRVELVLQEVVPVSKMHIDSSIGFYCVEDYLGEQWNVTNMVNWASMARKKAKQATGSEVCFFTSEMSDRARWETELEIGGREALLNGEIIFYLQPKVDIREDCAIQGAEVLARWHYPGHGWISPAEFITMFENNGLIIELDRYIFDEACKWYAQNRKQEESLFQLSVNVSRQGLLRADFLEYYTNVKERYGIADGVLELEFTESVVLDNYLRFQFIVEELQKKGFICSIDDFGSGYSSLNVLKNLTIDALKLDALFLRGGIDAKREQIIISYFIHMAHALGIKIVAEGVETTEQVMFLQHAECDVVQGYYFSKPLSLTDFEQLMTETKGHLYVSKI